MAQVHLELPDGLSVRNGGRGIACVGATVNDGIADAVARECLSDPLYRQDEASCATIPLNGSDTAEPLAEPLT